MPQDSPIFFWNPDNTWQSFMSQWYPVTFHDDEMTYHTTEMYMMIHKAKLFGDEETARKIAEEATTPKDQKELGRQVKNFNSTTWNENKSKIVEQGNFLKFSQGQSIDGQRLKALLLSTGTRELVEASPEDRIWGIGYSAKDAFDVSREEWGQNLLGEALMRARERLRQLPQ